MSFQGTQEVSVDAKGRIAVPTKQRAYFAAGAVLTQHPDNCLFLYPVLEWERVRGQLMDANNSDPQARWWQRVMVGSAELIELDAAGRILIPQVHRDFAQIKDAVRFIGNLNRFEIWDVLVYKAEFEAQRPMMVGGAAGAGLEKLRV